MSDGRVLWHDARRIAFDAGATPGAEHVPLAAAAGRVLAQDLRALCALPHYASSAMDGWAVAGPGPWRLRAAGSEAPGAARPAPAPSGSPSTPSAHSPADVTPLRSGEAVPIVTGGVIPAGARAVLRAEHGREDEGLLLATGPDANEPRDGQHVRPPGGEADAGELLFRAGTVLSAPHIAVAAGCGQDALEVVRRARVELLLTGSEVVTSGIPAAGQVRDSFGPTLPAVLAALGAEVVASHRVGDDRAALTAHLAAEPEPAPPPAGPHAPAAPRASAELVVTTGGTGSSGADHVRPALRAAGAELLVDGIAVRPGGPALLARMPDGRLVVALPGNPLAAFLALLTLAQPLLAAMQGRPMPALRDIRTAVDLPAAPAPATLRPYRTHNGAAEPTAWHGAGMLRGLAEADGVLVVPGRGAPAGTVLEVLPLPW